MDSAPRREIHCKRKSAHQQPVNVQRCHLNKNQKLRTFDLIREAVLPEYRDRVDDYLTLYEQALHAEQADAEYLHTMAHQLKGYLRGLNTTRVIGMADFEALDRRVTESWLEVEAY